jgi:hypothetical protein
MLEKKKMEGNFFNCIHSDKGPKINKRDTRGCNYTFNIAITN